VNDDLGQFAGPALLLVEPEHARELHAQGGGALVLAPLLEVHVSGLDNADGVEAGVLEEALVFGGGDGVHQNARNVREPHDAAFFPAGPRDVGDDLRLELVFPREVLSVRETIWEIRPPVNLMTPASWSK